MESVSVVISLSVHLYHFFGMNNLDVYANGFENEFTTTACIKQTTTDIIKNLNNIVEACYHLPGDICRWEGGAGGLLTRGSK